jgi:hypothetical protein
MNATQPATTISDRLAHPDTVPSNLTAKAWWRQSLAHGAPGIALLHIESAAQGLRPWRRAHDWITYLAAPNLTGGPDSHLYYGAPALAHVLACAASHQPRSYRRALDALDRDIASQAQRRVDAAHTRIEAGGLAALSEFDLIRGLTGLGAYLLRRDPHSAPVGAIVEYLVRLTEPIRHDGETMPGWWTASSPTGRASPRFVGGHANTGMAHGIAGPLALLSLAALAGVRVDGQTAAIARILAWLDRWRTDTHAGPVWPYWVNRAQLRAGRRELTDDQPPTWCYGTAGVVRAQQLAALATADRARQTVAEHALIQALSTRAAPTPGADISLCHGHAGFALTALTIAADADPPTARRLHALLPALADTLTNFPGNKTTAVPTPGSDYGLLEGSAGIGLATLAIDRAAPPLTGWHSCLLLA